MLHMQFWAGRFFINLSFLMYKMQKNNNSYFLMTMRIKQDDTYNVLLRKIPRV